MTPEETARAEIDVNIATLPGEAFKLTPTAEQSIRNGEADKLVERRYRESIVAALKWMA